MWIAGPIAGFLVAVPTLFIGIWLSHVVKLPADQSNMMELGEPLLFKLASWLVRQLRRYGGPLYPAESQARYKLKWAPDIVECEYLAARPISFRGILDLMILTRSI